MWPNLSNFLKKLLAESKMGIVFINLLLGSALFAMTIAVDSPILQQKECLEANEEIFFSVKKVDIPRHKNAYNPSIVATKEGYILFFRYDETNEHFFHQKKFGGCTYIGYCHLSKELDVVSKPRFLDLKSAYAEDPRAISYGGKIYVFYNDIDFQDSLKRKMKIAVLEQESLKVETLYFIPGGKRKVEKNWTPVVFNEGEKQRLGFIYSFDDLSLFTIDFVEKKIVVEPYGTEKMGGNYPFAWLKKYGFLRGGAPVFYAEDRFWAFFHSYFKIKTPVSNYEDRKDFFYVGGLVTFTIKPSIHFDKISRFPLLYEGAFSTKRVRCFDKMVIYPSGCVYDKESRVVLLAVGENDSGIKLLKADLDLLKKSMEKVNP